jgi:hypothetical protein
VKLFFEEFRAAIGIAEILGGIAARADLHTYCATLERRVEIGHAPPMRMIQSFRDAKNGSQPADHALIIVIQRRVRRVMPGRLRLPIVIANYRRDDGTVSALKAWNVSVERKVFAMLVMPAVANHVANIVEQCAGFQ